MKLFVEKETFTCAKEQIMEVVELRNKELEAMLEKVIEINKHHNFNGHLVNDQTFKQKIKMLNTTIIKTNTEINTPAMGIIQRSNIKSFFIRCHYDSQRAKELFNENPQYNGDKISVLQILLIEKGNILVECIKKDFEETIEQ